MKSIITIILFFFSYQIFACSCVCSIQNPIEAYLIYQDVYIGKVEKVDKIEGFKQKIKIKIEKVYKGNPSEVVLVEKDVKYSDCSKPYLYEGDKWLFFTSKDKEGNQIINYCNPSKNFEPSRYVKRTSKKKSDKYRSDFKRYLKVVDFVLNSNNLKDIPLEKLYPISGGIITYDKRNEFKLLQNKFESDFGIYLITFNINRSIKNIKIVQSLGKEVDSFIIKKAKESKNWRNFGDKNRDNFFKENQSKILLFWKNGISYPL